MLFSAVCLCGAGSQMYPVVVPVFTLLIIVFLLLPGARPSLLVYLLLYCLTRKNLPKNVFLCHRIVNINYDDFFILLSIPQTHLMEHMYILLN